MAAKNLSAKFDEAIALFSQGKAQEGADILFELAEAGHIQSVEELSYILLDQEDYEIVRNLIEQFPDQNNPTILYLRAKLIEATIGFDVQAYELAANAGKSNAAVSLVEYYCSIYRDKSQAKRWLEVAEQLEHPKIQFFREMVELVEIEKVFTIAVGSDDSDEFLEVRVYEFDSGNLVEKFNDLSDAVEFCHRKDRGFEVVYVGDTWDIRSTDFVFRCRVVYEENRITISENYVDYWFGELKDIDTAIEELLEKESDWEFVYCELDSDDEEDDYDEESENYFDLNPEEFTFVGSFKVDSGRVYVADPSNIEDYVKLEASESNVWTTSTLGLTALDFGDLSTHSSRRGDVYVEENEDGRVIKAVITFDGPFDKAVSTEEFAMGNWLLVNSGQLMIGDPQFLDQWNGNDGEEWKLDGKIGEFSYQGASATTLANSFGVLADGKSVVFNTGYGDGNYYIFFQISNADGELFTFDELREEGGVPPGSTISKVVIDFLTEVNSFL